VRSRAVCAASVPYVTLSVPPATGHSRTTNATYLAADPLPVAAAHLPSTLVEVVRSRSVQPSMMCRSR